MGLSQTERNRMAGARVHAEECGGRECEMRQEMWTRGGEGRVSLCHALGVRPQGLGHQDWALQRGWENDLIHTLAQFYFPSCPMNKALLSPFYK